MKNLLHCIRFAFVFGCSVFIGCSDEEQVSVSEPTVETSFVEVREIGGAVFSGQLTRHEVISDHGFIYGRDSILKAPLTKTVPLGKPVQSGSFEYDLAVGLQKDEVYFFQAYIMVSGAIIYGEIKSFFSNGSVPPVIDGISPEKGHLGETIVIYGKNFGNDSFYTRIKFGDAHPDRSYHVSDTAISVTIPATLSNELFQLKVTVFDKSAEAPYQLHTPEIHSISPLSGTFRDIVSIHGGHFDTIPERNEVWLGEVKAIVASSSRNEIKFVVPDDLQQGRVNIKINSQLQEVISGEAFTLFSPEIYEFPECASSDTHFEIKGAFFNPDYSRNQVFFGDVGASVVGGDASTLKVVVPYGPFPMSKAIIKLQVTDISVYAEREICIDDDWVMISKPLPFDFYRDIGTFSFPDRGYVISTSYSQGGRYLWEFDPDNESWIRSNLPFPSSLGGISADNGEKGYVYVADRKDNFWEFDPQHRQWKKVADFPGATRGDVAMFCIGKFVYIGIGQDVSWRREPYRDFYRYDSDTNKWTRIKDIVLDPDFGRHRTSVFVIDGHAYLVGGALHTGQNDTWKYFPKEDLWRHVADLPEAYSMTSHFSLNGKGYLANGMPQDHIVWEYDPLTNTWAEFYSIGHYWRYGGFAFVTKGKAYVGGGSVTGNSTPDAGKELYRLNR